MNCTDVAAILDDHALSRLSAAARCALDEHVTACVPCSFAWHAQSALLALPVPLAAPANCSIESLLAVGSQTAPRRRGTSARRDRRRAARRRCRARSRDRREDAADPARARPRRGRFRRGSGRSHVPRPGASLRAIPMRQATQTQLRRRHNTSTSKPAYVWRSTAARVPAGGAQEKARRRRDAEIHDRRARRREGRRGRSLERPMFEASAVAAVSQWKYLPRVVAGSGFRPVGIETIIRFTLDRADSAPSEAGNFSTFAKGARCRHAGQRKLGSGCPAYASRGCRPSIAASRSRGGAWRRRFPRRRARARRAPRDVRSPRQTDAIRFRIFYGYIYTQYGDYGRAIDAYEKAVAAADSAQGRRQWTPLANLYFARHQYDMALKTLLRYRDNAAGRKVPRRQR